MSTKTKRLKRNKISIKLDAQPVDSGAWQFYRHVATATSGRRQKIKQKSDNWCISPTNYPHSAPLSNWSLYFAIFAVFPFSFGYLSGLFKRGQWEGLIIPSRVSTRPDTKSLGGILANYAYTDRFFQVIDLSKNYLLFGFFRHSTLLRSIYLRTCDGLN